MNNLNSILDYLKVFNNINKRPAYKPRTMVQEPRNMYNQGQLVQNTVDGSRPGYSGSVVARLLKFIQHFKKTFNKIPTQNEIHIGTGAATKTIKSHLNVGTDFIITSSKDVRIMGGKKRGAKMKELAGSVSEVSSDLIKEVNATNKKGMSVAIDTSAAGSKFIRLRITHPSLKGFGDEGYPATKANLEKIKTKIKKIEKSPEYRSVNPFKTDEYHRKLVNLKYAQYKKEDPFGIYKKLQAYKTEKFPGSLSSDIQIQHGQPKFTTQTLSRWGLIPKHVQTIEPVVKTERIRNELLSQVLVKLKNPNRSIADKEKIIGEFNNAMRGLRGQLKGTEGQGLVNFELLELDKMGNVAKLKDVGFNPKKGLAYGEDLGELDFAKISKKQADQIIDLGKKKIDQDLLRKVLPSKLKNIVNPTPLSRYYEAGGRVGFGAGGWLASGGNVKRTGFAEGTNFGQAGKRIAQIAKLPVKVATWLASGADLPIEYAFAHPYMKTGDTEGAKYATSAGLFGAGAFNIESIKESNPKAYQYGKNLQLQAEWEKIQAVQQEIGEFKEEAKKKGTLDQINTQYLELFEANEKRKEVLQKIYNNIGYTNQDGDTELSGKVAFQKFMREKQIGDYDKKIDKAASVSAFKDTDRDAVKETIKSYDTENDPRNFNKITDLKSFIEAKGEPMMGNENFNPFTLKPGLADKASRYGVEGIFDNFVLGMDKVPYSQANYEGQNYSGGKDIEDLYSSLPIKYASQLAKLEKEDYEKGLAAIQQAKEEEFLSIQGAAEGGIMNLRRKR